MAEKPIPLTINPWDSNTNQINLVWQGYYNSLGSASFAPNTVSYITKTPSSDLPNEQALSTLASGFLKVTTASGVLSSTGFTTIQNSDLANSSITINSTSISLGSSATITAAPSGSASGDLSGTYPSPTVASINGVALGTTTATSGNVLIGSGTQWVTKAISGDATLSSAGALTVTKTNGVSFAASATTDTTNASNISSGTLNSSRLPTITGKLIGIQVFTSTGANTYTPTSGMATCIAEVVGAGGGSGGCKGVAGSNGATGGGASGSYLKVQFTAAQIGASQTVTIGTGGTAGVGATPTSGGKGGNTTIGTLVTAGGGNGSGSNTAANTILNPSAGGTATANTVSTGTTLMNITGQAGGIGLNIGTTYFGVPGVGGSNPLGQGGVTQASGSATAGAAGTGYGAGAGGAVATASSADGAAGQNGFCIIYEYS